MSDAHQESGVPPEVDTGLACLVMLARFHNVAASPEQLVHEFTPHGESFALPELLLAAKHLGLKAKAVRSTLERLSHTPLPAIAGDANGGFFIVARLDDGKALIHDPRTQRAEVLPLADLGARWNGELVLIRSEATIAGELSKFDFTWFIPAIVKYRKLLGEVLLVSFVLQLFALITPLFFQVVMDKVLVHRGLSTLDVIAIGLLGIMSSNRCFRACAVMYSPTRRVAQAAEIQAARATVASLKESLPITRQLSADYKRLLDKAIVGKHAWLEKEQARMDQERELLVQQAHVLELMAAKKEAERRQNSILAQTRRATLDLQYESDQLAAALAQELKKAEQRNRLTRLIAPVVGTVQQLAIHTEGGVVTEAQSLMVIVPSDQSVEVEAMLENKDIGFLHPGQVVEIKVETLTFTKYGVVHGTVISISNDAIEDEKLGLLYSTRIQLKENTIRVGDEQIALSPGVAVRAEVKTDKRKVIDYFLSPLKEYQDESLGAVSFIRCFVLVLA
ncbi:HlyD family type I secretion periplasmic adaptor subunit [Pseudomonas sp. CR3202]|uniref:HlyD family type I secretion periplasmic adaptor subunit n=1 Tax=Pseudomonas sp. CR3202 TaxID=3351532 RepID=UPI003BF3B866